MVNPSTNEVLFIVIILIIFFILLGVCLFCVHKATSLTKREKRALEQQQRQQQQQLHVQYITAAQLESLRPPELARHLYGEKQEIMNDNRRRSILNKLLSLQQQQQGMVRPSSMREPSFRPMTQPPTIVVVDEATNNNARLPPPAYGDHRSSIPVPCEQAPPIGDEKYKH